MIGGGLGRSNAPQDEMNAAKAGGCRECGGGEERGETKNAGCEVENDDGWRVILKEARFQSTESNTQQARGPQDPTQEGAPLVPPSSASLRRSLFSSRS
eukprot:3941393-Rhodomonas_salina.2